MKVLTIVGARPQFIKASVVSRAFAKSTTCEEVIVHTGQHYDSNLSDIFFSELKIPVPQYHLGVGSDSHGLQTGKMLAAIEQVILREKPDILLVYGDTNSTLAGALAAAKLHIRVAHVEAGLRSFNRKMPEEINRIATDHMADYCFTPCDNASQQLLKEGICQNIIHQVGDVMFDVVKHYGAQANKQSQILKQLNLKEKQYCLCTVHRAENTDDPQRLKAIMTTLMTLAETYPIIFPLHPRSEKYLQQYDIFAQAKEKIIFISPLGYLDMLCLSANAALVLTDSGGLQKEAYFNKTLCVTFRDQTEWVELVEHRWNYLVPPGEPGAMLDRIQTILVQDQGSPIHLYGDGTGSDKIVDIVTTL